MSTAELAGTVISFAIFLCVPPFSMSIVHVASLSVTLVTLNTLILYTCSASPVTKVVVKVVVVVVVAVVVMVVVAVALMLHLQLWLLLLLWLPLWLWLQLHCGWGWG